MFPLNLKCAGEEEFREENQEEKVTVVSEYFYTSRIFQIAKTAAHSSHQGPLMSQLTKSVNAKTSSS